ncbi:MAG TPA: hypothetical protein VH912_24180 [Streptosporangiaceae bacterium]|jgi:hypothetical protein
MTVPSKSPRGRAASSEIVKIYQILRDAGEPMTVPEIAERFPRTGYVSQAMQDYAKHKAEVDPTWLEGKTERWSDAAQDEAFVWWVRKVVRLGAHIRILNVRAKPVQNAHGRTREGTYSPGRAPKVRRRVWVEKTVLVDWTPDLETELNRGHAAGMQFLSRLAEYRTGQRHKAADTKELLDLAERAIRAHS